MTDSELIEGCLKGSKKAQNELFLKYSGQLLVICMRYTGDRMEAEDALQEGFIRIFKKIGTFKADANPLLFPWMRRVMVNTTLNYLRDNKKYKFTTEFNGEEYQQIDEISDGCIEELFQEISPQEILKIIGELPAGYRTVFNLYAFENYGHNEIANTLNISVNTSKTQLMKARKTIISKIYKTVNPVLETKLVNQ